MRRLAAHGAPARLVEPEALTPPAIAGRGVRRIEKSASPRLCYREECGGNVVGVHVLRSVKHGEVEQSPPPGVTRL